MFFWTKIQPPTSRFYQVDRLDSCWGHRPKRLAPNAPRVQARTEPWRIPGYVRWQCSLCFQLIVRVFIKASQRLPEKNWCLIDVLWKRSLDQKCVIQSLLFSFRSLHSTSRNLTHHLLYVWHMKIIYVSILNQVYFTMPQTSCNAPSCFKFTRSKERPISLEMATLREFKSRAIFTSKYHHQQIRSFLLRFLHSVNLCSLFQRFNVSSLRPHWLANAHCRCSTR